jgi:aspartate racemase
VSSPGTEGRCLGLIGGLGPGATVHYYREIVAAHATQSRVPKMLIAHADVGLVYAFAGAKDFDGLARYLNGFIAAMAAGGAEFTAIVAATPHICVPQLAAISRLPLIDMLAEVASAVRKRGLTRVALLGTRFTLETRMFGQLEEAVMPKPDELARVGEIYSALVAGRASPAQIDELRGLARTFMTRDGAQAVLLAGTDLSGVLTEDNCDFPLIDCARIHIDAIVRRMLG